MIDTISFVEGWHYAREVMKSVKGHSKEWFDDRGADNTIIDNLLKTADSMPNSYAEGIRQALRELKNE